ncbi:MAG: SIS domain-containing protein [Candidatus Latescibacteria bacterium]|nr:SIS domain-containing protein [Candidatus Latescibacterota bacterium]
MNLHIEEMLSRFPVLSPCIEDMERAYDMISTSFSSGGKLLLCGNGGSAADAEHWAGELLKGFRKKRPLGGGVAHRLDPGTAVKLQGALPAIPLTGFLSFGTAFANDADPAFTFAQLVLALGRPGDVLAGISTSGNAENVVNAVRTAKALGLGTLGLTGGSGGRLALSADISIKAPATVVHEVQEYHVPVYHTICAMLEERFFPDPAGPAG